jgi:hypothetical protein
VDGVKVITEAMLDALIIEAVRNELNGPLEKFNATQIRPVARSRSGSNPAGNAEADGAHREASASE